MKLKKTYTIRVYISRGFKYSDSIRDSFRIKLRFNDEPNTEMGSKDKHELTQNSYNKLYTVILSKYNTTPAKVDIHYSSYFTDQKSKRIYPRYVIITDETLHTDFLIKKRDETIDQALD